MNFSDMIEKAKYISRKRVGNKYVYKYPDDNKGPGRQKKMDPALDPDRIKRMAVGAKKRIKFEQESRMSDKDLEQKISEGKQFEPFDSTMEGQFVIMGRAGLAALPATGKKSSKQWVVFDVDTREQIAILKRNEVRAWLYRDAKNKFEG